MPMSLPELPFSPRRGRGDQCGAVAGDERSRHNLDWDQGLVCLPVWFVVVRGYTHADFRARQHRSMLCARSGSKRKARVAKAFALLLESGTMYSVLLVSFRLKSIVMSRVLIATRLDSVGLVRTRAGSTKRPLSASAECASQSGGVLHVWLLCARCGKISVLNPAGCISWLTRRLSARPSTRCLSLCLSRSTARR